MDVTRNLPEIGRVVEVVQGRDCGLFAVVIGRLADRYVLIADGNTRRIEKPKKKNVAHVRMTSYVATDIVALLDSEGKVSNANLRYALRVFGQTQSLSGKGREEGGIPDGQG